MEGATIKQRHDVTGDVPTEYYNVTYQGAKGEFYEPLFIVKKIQQKFKQREFFKHFLQEHYKLI